MKSKGRRPKVKELAGRLAAQAARYICWGDFYSKNKGTARQWNRAGLILARAARSLERMI
jgi:hypothetical protein